MKRTRLVVAGACLLVFLVVVASLPTDSHAFKGNTHVWVAQEVLNDVVDDGMVDIPPFGEFSVIPEVVIALQSYPNEYRMGSLGPDGFPDLVGGQMTVHPGRYSLGGWKTDDWLKHLVANIGDDRERAFVYGYLTHAATDVFSHSYVNLYAGDAFVLTDGVEEEARHMALEEFIKEHQPPLMNQFGDYIGTPANVVEPEWGQNSAAPAAFLRDVLILNPDAANQYRADPVTQYLASMYDLWDTQGKIIDKMEQSKLIMEENIKNIEDEINRIKDMKFDIRVDTILGTVSFTVKLYPAYCFLDPASCIALELFEHTTLPIARETVNFTINGMKIPMELWRGQVEEATKQYIVTSGKVVRETMITHTGAPGEKSPTDHLSDWVCNWAPTFAGIPHVVILPLCATINFVSNGMDGIDQVRSTVSEKLGVLGWAIDPLQKVDELINNELKPKFERLAEDLGDNILGPNSMEMSIARLMLQSNGDAAGLNTEFSGDPSGKGLLLIPDVSTRVLAEMRIDGTGKFNKNAYPPAYNSVVLAKLALLPPNELNRLAAMSGSLQYHVYDPSYTQIASLGLKPPPRVDDLPGFPPISSPLYNGTPEDTNILFDAVASIDGSHQWQKSAPAYPRREGYSDTGYQEDKRQYGYAYGRAAGTGLRFWQDCELRDKVFLKLFKGPLAEGVEAPNLLGLPELPVALNGIPNFNNNRASWDDPFPVSFQSPLPMKVRPTNRHAWEIPFTPTSALDMVVDLDSQACGGSPDNPLEYSWSFIGTCGYTCEYNESTRRIECVSPSCPTITDLQKYSKSFPYCGYEFPRGDLGMDFLITAEAGSNCPDIPVHLVRPGVFTATLQAEMATTQSGNCLDYMGMRLCNHEAQSTNLLMRTNYAQQIRVNVKDPATGISTNADVTVTAHPSSLNYSSFVNVSADVLSLTGLPACDVPPFTLNESVPVDVTPPVITPPPDRTFECDNERYRVINLGTATASDDRDASVTVYNDGPTAFPLGLTVVTYSAADSAGNTSTARQNVWIVDTRPPSFGGITGLPNVLVKATNPHGTPVSLAPPAVSDRCTLPSEIQVWTDTNLTALPIGETSVIWKAMDRSGNLATITQFVTVNPLRGDINIDGSVNAADVPLMRASIGSNEGGSKYNPFADLDGDKQITLSDYRILRVLVASPPICNAGGPYQRECAGQTTSAALNGTGSRDLDGYPLTYTWNGPFAAGTVTGATPTVQFSGFGSFGVSLGVRDDFGSTAVCSSVVAVVDTTPPTIQSVSATPNILWPPDLKMVPVNVKILSSDICDPTLACRISSVSSNEPVNGLGDGDTAPDWVITGDFTLNLRAERSGTGKGRIYTISVTCTDDSGNSSAATTNVRVPFTKGK